MTSPDAPTTMTEVLGVFSDRPVHVDSVIAAINYVIAYVAYVQASIPAGSINPNAATRIATGATATVLSTDNFVGLNGPTAVTLPAAPKDGFSVLLKDLRASGGADVVISAGAATIDGKPTLTFTNPYQAATLTFVAGSGYVIS